MKYQPTPISYAKVNPLGQLVVGLENGTILNAGNVIGQQGSMGLMGPTGHTGPFGPMGPSVVNMTINNRQELIYSLSDNPLYMYNAGKVPGITGHRGPRGHSIVACDIDKKQNLFLTTDAGQKLTAGKVFGATGLIGPIGPTGPRGIQGKPFTVSQIFTVENTLLLVDDMNIAYTCGYVGITGPTGSSDVLTSININDTGHLILSSSNSTIYDAGYILGSTGPQGSVGPTGNRGRPGPMLKFKNIYIQDDELIFEDEYGTNYNVGKLPIITELKNEIEDLKLDIDELKTEIGYLNQQIEGWRAERAY